MSDCHHFLDSVGGVQKSLEKSKKCLPRHGNVGFDPLIKAGIAWYGASYSQAAQELMTQVQKQTQIETKE